MKKALIPIMSALLVATVFTGCRGNVATETHNTTANTTQATAKPTETTQATAKPTETSRPTQPAQTTQPSQMPSIQPDTSDATGDSGRGGQMMPRY